MLFSRETVDVPVGVCGYAMPKTRLCEEGISCLTLELSTPRIAGQSPNCYQFRKTAYRMTKRYPLVS